MSFIPARKSKPPPTNTQAAWALLVLLVVGFVVWVAVASLLQWGWNGFVVGHVHGATRASLNAALLPSAVLLVLRHWGD